MSSNDNYTKLLRQKAETISRERSADADFLSPGEIRKLVHELQVHQIELELQNEELRGAQQELEISRNSFLQLFHKAPVGYLVLDNLGMICQANETFCLMTQQDIPSVTGKAFSQFIPEPERRYFIGRYRAVFKKPGGKSMELPLLRKGRQPFHARIETATLPQLNNPSVPQEEPRLLITISDITEQKRDRRALQQSEEKYRQLAESTAAIFWEYNIWANRWTYISPQVTAVLGYLPEAWTDQQFWADRIHPEDREWAIQHCAAYTERGEKHVFEYRFLKGDGTYAWLQDDVNVEMQDGKPVVLRGFLLDITERKEAEQKIAAYTGELEQLYHQLDAEMDKGRLLHERTLPQILPQVPGLSFAAHYQPAQRLGGDFYDVLRSGSKLVLYLSDVTGHGLDGAMLSVFVKEAIDSYVNLRPDELYPHRILGHLDRQFRRENYPEDYFISIFLAVLDLETMELRYSGAGFHNTPLLRLGDGTLLKLVGHGLFLAPVLPDEMMEFQEDSINLTSHSTIFLHTDGLTEQEADGLIYGEKLPAVFQTCSPLPPAEIVQAVNEDFKRFNRGSLQGDDDITFLVVQVD